MKSTISTTLCQFWTYVLMALVIFQLAEFASSQPFATEPLFRFCGADLYTGVSSVCLERGYDLNKDPTLASECCTQGCTYLGLSIFCKQQQPQPNTNRPRYRLCGSDYYTALDSLCVNGYETTYASYQSSQCCSSGCPLSLLVPICKRQRVGVL